MHGGPRTSHSTMHHRHRIALIICSVLGFTTLSIRSFDRGSDTPSDACHARLISIDNPRFARTGQTTQFDGTLLFRPMSLYVDGTLETGGHVYRLNRLMIWKQPWLAASSHRLESTHRYVGDGVPTDVASQLPVFGEPQMDLHFVKVNPWLYSVFSNDVFIAYCRRMPDIDTRLLPHGQTEIQLGEAFAENLNVP
jgi:hypothetical protein